MAPDSPILDPRDELLYLRRKQRLHYLEAKDIPVYDLELKGASHSAIFLGSHFLAWCELAARRGLFGVEVAQRQLQRDMERAAEEDEKLEAQARQWKTDRQERDADRIRRERDETARRDREGEARLRQKGIGR